MEQQIEKKMQDDMKAITGPRIRKLNSLGG